MGLLFRASGFLLVGTCFLAMNFVLMFLFGFLRNLPALMTVARRVFRELLYWTVELYRPVVKAVDPILQEYLSVDSRNPYLRMAATSTLSLLSYLTIFLLVGWHISWLGAAMAGAFGSIAGFVWNDIENAEGLRIGESLE